MCGKDEVNYFIYLFLENLRRNYKGFIKMICYVFVEMTIIK